jgi:hypothetical protein
MEGKGKKIIYTIDHGTRNGTPSQKGKPGSEICILSWVLPEG